MVGLIQKILMDIILDIGGEDAVKQVKQIAGLPEDHAYQINNVYSDEEWKRLLAAAMEVLKVTPEQVDDIYADYFMNDVLKRFPVWFTMAKNSQEFLLIQPTIHNCFATSVADQKSRDEINDKFKVDYLTNKIVVHYRSHNHHCGLYKSLAKWVIGYYKDEAMIKENQCSLNGAPECEIHIEWSKLAPSAKQNEAIKAL